MNAIELCKILGDESRARIVSILSRGSFNVQELTSILDLSQSTVSHHLKALLNLRVIESKKEGTWVYYVLSSNGISGFIQQYLELLAKDQLTLNILSNDQQKIDDILSARRDSAHRYFESVADRWEDLRSEALASQCYYDLVKEHIPKDGTLADLGCGRGGLLERILPRSGDTIAIDYSKAMLSEAKMVLGDFADKIDFRLGYLEHLPLGDDSVGIAVAHMVFHHISNPVDALTDICRVLTNSGRLVIVDLVEHINEIMRERFADQWLGFKVEEVQRWAEQTGFKDIKVSFLGDNREAFLMTMNKE